MRRIGAMPSGSELDRSKGQLQAVESVDVASKQEKSAAEMSVMYSHESDAGSPSSPPTPSADSNAADRTSDADLVASSFIHGHEHFPAAIVLPWQKEKPIHWTEEEPQLRSDQVTLTPGSS